MGLKTQSMQSELRAIRSICDGEAAVRTRLLSILQDAHFVTDTGEPLWQRIRGLLRHDKSIPNVAILRQDPTLEEDVQEALGITDEKCEDEEEANALVDQLELFRKLRVIYDGTAEVVSSMKEPSAETVDEALGNLDNIIVKARSNFDDLELIHAGHGSNAQRVVDQVLSLEKPDRILTGFTKFDEASGGFARKDLVLVAANTGGGKSVMAEQMGINAYKHKRNVCIVSFEMDEEEIYARLLSNVSGVPFSTVYLRTFASYTQQQKEYPTRNKLYDTWQSFNKHGEIEGCKFTVWCPTVDATPNQIAAILKPGNYDIVFIDYVGLVSADKEGALWENLGEITKGFKGMARKNDCVVVVMAQLDEDTNKVKYSKAMRHHSSYVWWWNYDDEAKETNQITVHQDKARHCKQFNFNLVCDFETMRFGIADDDPKIQDEDISAKDQVERKQAAAAAAASGEKSAPADEIADMLAAGRANTEARQREFQEKDAKERAEKRVELDLRTRRLANITDDFDENDL